MKSSIFWDVTPYHQFKINRSFGETCYLHLQGRRANFYPLYGGALLGLFFDPGDEDEIFLRNVG
jgi:hypothetical protein